MPFPDIMGCSCNGEGSKQNRIPVVGCGVDSSLRTDRKQVTFKFLLDSMVAIIKSAMTTKV